MSTRPSVHRPDDLPAPPSTEIPAPAAPATLSRRTLLAAGGGLVATSTASAAVPFAPSPAPAEDGQALSRREEVFRVRVRCAWDNSQLPFPPPNGNGDEQRYPNRIGNFAKGLPHDSYGEVDVAAYAALLRATETGRMEDFEAVPSGTRNPDRRNKLVNPMAGVAFELEGLDSHQFTIRPAPALASAEAAGEIAENYWMALLRDVPFERYGADALAGTACADLSRMQDFRGPKVGGRVVPSTLFRSDAPGCSSGPYVSQFLWRAQPFGAQFVEPRLRTAAPGVDYLTDAAQWLAVQNGTLPTVAQSYDSVRRYIRNGRDLGQWVHVDVLFQAYFQAMLALVQPPDAGDPERSGLGCPLNQGNPYLGSRMQLGFGTFGGPHVATLTCEVATRALKAVWYQKWFVHRRLRPEEYAGRVHHLLTGGRRYPIHPDILNSLALNEVKARHESFLLPQAFPEGCPVHPAYGAGHATVAGACVTILKALFDESFVIPNPVVASDDGLTLLPYSGPPLTVGGELNKLAANVAYGRNIAGVHWRTDGSESLRLGEEVAISMLRDQRSTYRESFQGFRFTRFDGTPVIV